MPQPCVRIDGGYALEKPWKVVQNASNSSPAADNRFDLPGGTAACWDGPECSFRISGCEGRREACSAHNGRTKGDLTACRAAPTLRCRSLGRGLPSWLGGRVDGVPAVLLSPSDARSRCYRCKAGRCAGGLQT